MGRVHTYKGRQLTVTFEAGRCIHAAECVRGLPVVFDPGRTPWIDPDGAGSSEVRAVLTRCPSGALKAEGGEPEAPEPLNSVRLVPDGPLYVRGRSRVLDAAGETVVQDYRLALCRCGDSRSKPFCDNRHRAKPFHHDGGVTGEVAAADLSGEAELRFQPVVDGPLHVLGPLRILDAEGQIRHQSLDTWLCRCGASKAKPFCDGSHKTCGFKAE